MEASRRTPIEECSSQHFIVATDAFALASRLSIIRKDTHAHTHATAGGETGGPRRAHEHTTCKYGERQSGGRNEYDHTATFERFMRLDPNYLPPQDGGVEMGVSTQPNPLGRKNGLRIDTLGSRHGTDDVFPLSSVNPESLTLGRASFTGPSRSTDKRKPCVFLATG